jgi:ATP-dependent RNA helicase DeaD
MADEPTEPTDPPHPTEPVDPVPSADPDDAIDAIAPAAVTEPGDATAEPTATEPVDSSGAPDSAPPAPPAAAESGVSPAESGGSPAETDTAPEGPFAGLPEPLRTAVEGHGFTDLTSVQRAVVDAAATGKNLRISSQTGSGKTVALAIAIAEDLIERAARDHREKKKLSRRGPAALIVAPTRELAQQFARELRWVYAEIRPLHVAVVTGGTDIGGERRVLNRRPLVLVGTPGRTLDHVRAGALDFSDLAHVVLDEADQMLDMGFKDELDAIVDALPENRHSYLVSATFPREVRRFANRFAPDAVAIEGTRLGVANADIEHVVYLVRERDRYAALVNNLLMMHGARVLIFVKRRADASELAERLSGDGFGALPFSGDLSQAQRNRTLGAFRRGVVQILVATDVAARGIDVADIAMVVHGDVPRDPESYTHRSGRTGRAGQSGRSILIATHRAERKIRRLLADADVESNWATVPTAKKIKKAVTKRVRRAIHAVMSEPTADEGARSYATDLLERYEPATLVAELLRLAEGELPHAPMELSAERPEQPRRHVGSFVTFTINWGADAGTTPARLLAHVCRRGGVDRHSVGAMQIDQRSSRFEIAEPDAAAFAKAASIEDPRDPHLVIERTEGPVRDGRGRKPARHPRRDPKGKRDGGRRRDYGDRRGGGRGDRRDHRDRDHRDRDRPRRGDSQPGTERRDRGAGPERGDGDTRRGREDRGEAFRAWGPPART